MIAVNVLEKETLMRLVHASACAIAIAMLVPALHSVQAQDADRKVAGGGITAKGWQGKVDAGAAKKGMSVADSKFDQQGSSLMLKTGPAAYYWNPTNVAKGDYMVKATFKEGKTTADHPHPYGLFIGGNKLGTDDQQLMYCVAYGNGDFLVRQFNGASVVQVTKRQPNPAVNKAAADGSTTNEVAWRVKGGTAECLINGKPVATLPAADTTGAGKLESTDGIYGIRVSHNVDLTVTGLALTK
jgi:opacity protein-like surface antigen